MDEVQVLEEAYDMPYDEVDLETVTIDPEPNENHVDDATYTPHIEAYIPFYGQHA